MKEIEIFVDVFDSREKALDLLRQKFGKEKIVKIHDIYFYDPLRKDLMLPENPVDPKEKMFRLRRKGSEALIAYKKDIFTLDGKYFYTEEQETSVADADTAFKIITDLGFKILIEIDNTRSVFLSGDYEIVLEDVKDLGLFLEVEYLGEAGENILEIKNRTQAFTDSLGIKISEELPMGKSRLMLEKIKNKAGK